MVVLLMLIELGALAPHPIKDDQPDIVAKDLDADVKR